MEGELTKIAENLKCLWLLENVLLIRRVGCPRTGEVISLVAASSPNSEDVFAACRNTQSAKKVAKKERCEA